MLCSCEAFFHKKPSWQQPHPLEQHSAFSCYPKISVLLFLPAAGKAAAGCEATSAPGWLCSAGGGSRGAVTTCSLQQKMEMSIPQLLQGLPCPCLSIPQVPLPISLCCRQQKHSCCSCCSFPSLSSAFLADSCLLHRAPPSPKWQTTF